MRRSGAGALVALAVIGCGALAQAQASPATRPGWLARTPAARTFADLGSVDHDTRRRAAERLADLGSHERVVRALTQAIEHEMVPDVLAAMVRSLAMRAEAGDELALTSGWERTTSAERRIVTEALAAIDGEEARVTLEARVREGLASACEALVRSEDRVRWLATRPIDRPIALCLVSAPPSSARDGLLVRIAQSAAPDVLRAVLAALAASPLPSDEASTLAEQASAADASLLPLAYPILSRGAPTRMSPEAWLALAATESEPAALRALLTIAPEQADELLATDRALGGPHASAALDVLLERDRPEDLARIAAFLAVEAERDRALDALATRHAVALLAREPAAPDRDLALALAGPEGDVREELSAGTSSSLVRALLGGVTREACTTRPEASADERRAAAACLSLLPEAGATAARQLETERDPSVVAWLVLAARDARSSARTLEVLLGDPSTAAAALARVAPSLDALAPADRRRLEGIVVRLARSDDAWTRAEALRAIGAIGRPVHAPVLIGALDDAVPLVRLAAARALPRVGIDVLQEPRTRGRARLETDARVRAALRSEPLATASAPLHVRVVAHDPTLAPLAQVRLELADGASLALTPIDGEVLVRDVPDAPAHAALIVPRTRGRD